MSDNVLLLSRQDVVDLLDMDACVAAVEDAFRRHARGQAPEPAVLGVHVPGGGFHVKAAALTLSRPYFASKCNGNFPGNPAKHGLPTIQGLLLLADAERGMPLAIMGSGEITAIRTAAATAVAAKYCAREDAHVLTIIGCGLQADYQALAVSRVRKLRKIWAVDREPEAAQRFAERVSAALKVPASVATDPANATRDSQMVVTCTTSRTPVLGQGDVSPGAFVAGVGADHPEKNELAPDLLAQHTVVTDVTGQCVVMGDLHHAVAAGRMTVAQVYAELGQLTVGKKPGRRRDDEIVVFDSTGTALQDVAAAAVVYERAVARGRGTSAAL